jgi:hypothetical protein
LAVLEDAVDRFPDLRAIELPTQAGVWKRNYGQILARFEAARASSPQRVEIARFIVERTQGSLLFVNDSGESQPLNEYFKAPIDAPALTSQQLGAAPAFKVDVPFEGERFQGRDALRLVERLEEHHEITAAAAKGLRWSIEHIEQQGGVLDLRGHRFVLLGAGAELAPTAALLAAGATVLWVDVADAERYLSARLPEAQRAGTLVRASAPLNLLETPSSIRAAIDAFAADGGPVHLGAFAYASGSSREWRLGAIMNAIASHLAPASLRSLAMWVSPTTVPQLQDESLVAAARQLAREPVWKATLSRTGILAKPGHYAHNGVCVGLSTVSIQGLSYQAAQYISKLCAAETFAVYGSAFHDADSARPLTVSANVAGITRTRSLSHPLFAAAFIGAPRFGVRIFAPETTRALSVLLMLNDLLNPAAPGAAAINGGGVAEKLTRLHSQQMHGGIYNLPYQLESAIRIAALIGMGKNPSLLLRRSQRQQAEAQA